MLRPLVPRAEPAELLVQQPAGHVRGLQRARHAARGRSRARSSPNASAQHPRRRDRALALGDGARRGLDLPDHSRPWPTTARSTSTEPWRKLAAKKRHQVLYGVSGRRIAVKWGTEEIGESRDLGDALRRRDQRAHATLSADQLRPRAREHYRKLLQSSEPATAAAGSACGPRASRCASATRASPRSAR